MKCGRSVRFVIHASVMLPNNPHPSTLMRQKRRSFFFFCICREPVIGGESSAPKHFRRYLQEGGEEGGLSLRPRYSALFAGEIPVIEFVHIECTVRGFFEACAYYLSKTYDSGIGVMVGLMSQPIHGRTTRTQQCADDLPVELRLKRMNSTGPGRNISDNYFAAIQKEFDDIRLPGAHYTRARAKLAFKEQLQFRFRLCVLFQTRAQFLPVPDYPE